MEREISLHPLVIVNVGDHLTRIRSSSTTTTANNNNTNTTPKQQRAFGVLLGIQEGKRAAVLDCMECLMDVKSDGTLQMNHAFMKEQMELYKVVFPRYEMLGWYAAGSGLQESDIALHKQMSELNESPLFLIMDPQRISTATTTTSTTPTTQKNNQLPLMVVEAVMQMVKDQPTMAFVEVPLKIDTVESERIVVDRIVGGAARSAADTSSSSLPTHVASLHNAVSMLRNRVFILKSFLQAIREGRIAPDRELLIQASSVCAQLPATDPTTIQQEFDRELNDAHLVSYVAAVAKGTVQVNHILEKFSISNPNPGVPPASSSSTSSSSSSSRGGGGQGGGKHVPF
jgi:COP9 signalosome complex subunit 6